MTSVSRTDRSAASTRSVSPPRDFRFEVGRFTARRLRDVRRNGLTWHLTDLASATVHVRIGGKAEAREAGPEVSFYPKGHRKPRRITLKEVRSTHDPLAQWVLKLFPFKSE